MWFKWIIVVILVLEVIGRISLIGKHRRPITPQDAALDVLFNGATIAGCLLFLRCD